MTDKTKRNYQKEYEKDKTTNKIYRVRVPIKVAQALDEKLELEHKTYSSIALEAIMKYLRKK